jgi:nitrogen fixation protein NifB
MGGTRVRALPATEQMEIMQHHPCFHDKAHERVGRVHLPVAPRCNIQCAFCERKVCANLTMQHPGWARQLLSPEEAVQLVHRLAGSRPGETFVVGVAGPGEPLANDETFEALGRVHEEYPALFKCLSTNGLLLEDRLPQILDVGIKTLTVTVNAPDSEVGQRIYLWIRYQGRVYRGPEGAEILIARQMAGIRAALDAGLVVKVNTVLIPGVNDRHVVRLARRLGEMGVHLMNIMPLIPCGHMKDRRAPTRDELSRARSDCEGAMPQFRLCEQCSADVVCFPLEKDGPGYPKPEPPGRLD